MKYRKIRSTFTRPLSKGRRKKTNEKVLNGHKTFQIKLILNDFKAYFGQNRPYLDEKFQSFFTRIFTLWERNEFKLQFTKVEYRILKYLGIKNDFVYMQLLSNLGEYGLDVQTFFILCLDALLNQDERFLNLLYDLILARKGVVSTKHGKKILEQIKEKREKDLKNFKKFSYEIND